MSMAVTPAYNETVNDPLLESLQAALERMLTNKSALQNVHPEPDEHGGTISLRTEDGDVLGWFAVQKGCVTFHPPGDSEALAGCSTNGHHARQCLHELVEDSVVQRRLRPDMAPA